MRRIFALIALTCIVCAGHASAQSNVLTFSIQHSYSSPVDLKLQSQDRSWEWPGNGDVWILDDNRIYTQSISCQPGEKICFSARPRFGQSTLYWGVNPNGAWSCSNCCAYCGTRVNFPNLVVD